MLNDPVFIALLGRAGGNVVLSAAELDAAAQVTVTGVRNPATGDVTLRIND